MPGASPWGGNVSSLLIRKISPGVREYHRGHGIIIILPAATATTVRTILYQQDGIEFELHGILFQFRLFQIDKAHLRMQRLAAQTMTTFAHGLYVQCLIILFSLLSLPFYPIHTKPPAPCITFFILMFILYVITKVADYPFAYITPITDTTTLITDFFFLPERAIPQICN